jgi:putative phosphoribosyl transferase
MALLKDRTDAGQKLAQKLLGYANRSDVIILALLRGVPVAFEVAKALQAPLDVFLVRKLGHDYSISQNTSVKLKGVLWIC